MSGVCGDNASRVEGVRVLWHIPTAARHVDELVAPLRFLCGPQLDDVHFEL